MASSHNIEEVYIGANLNEPRVAASDSEDCDMLSRTGKAETGELELIFVQKPLYDFVKRLFDIFASFIGIIILAIPCLLIAVLIKLTSKGPVFYMQERLGKNGTPFVLCKFRTMRVDAEEDGPQWAEKEDPRITGLGKILRGFRIDELPQLANVFLGQMSLIGPRPERECFHKQFVQELPAFDYRIKVKQGLTGWAQVNGGYESSPEEKLTYDIEYINNRSLWFDIKILFKTVMIVLFRRGAR